MSRLTTGAEFHNSLLGVGIDPDTMGANILGVKAGTSTNDAATGGVLYETHAGVGNVGTGEDIIASISIPANTLAVDGQGLRFFAFGTFAANGNGKRIRVRFGTTGTNLILDTTAQSISGGMWYLEGWLVRTAATVQRGAARVDYGANNAGTVAQTLIGSQAALSQTLSGAIVLEVTGEATANNDIVCNNFIVEWMDANT